MSNEHPGPARTACVFCSGELKNTDQAEHAARNCDLVLAADAGANHLARLGVRPQVVVGDTDSIAPDLWPDGEEIVRIHHPTGKHSSDAELAVGYALQQGCQQVVLIAALGGRLDHTLANVALVAEHPGRVAILDGGATLVAVDKSEKCVLHGPPGTDVSLIPYGPGAGRVRTAGLRYPLRDESLANAARGLGNELVEGQGCVCVSEGILLVYVGGDGTWPIP